MKSLKNITLDGNTGHFDKEIYLAGHRAWTSSFRGSFRFLGSAFAASAQLLTWRIDSALGSEFKSFSSSELRSHQMAIRSHPGVEKMPASGISSELGAHRALEASSRPSCFVPFISLPRLATPALGLGVIGSLRPSVFYVFLRRYGRRSGQPSSSSLARRACVHPRIAVFVSWCCCLQVQVFLKFAYWDTLKFASAPGISGGRGGMAMAVASSARLAFFVVRSAPVVRRTPDAFPLCSLYSDGPLSSRPQPLT